MRIAFDMDGVLADLHHPFVQTALRLFPDLDETSVQAPDVGASPPDRQGDTPKPDALQTPVQVVLSARQSDAVWRHLSATENFWESLAEIEPGALARLARLADERRWEVIFITSRPESAGQTVQRQTQRWIQARGFPLPSVFVVHGSRGRIADALRLDIVVDDRPDNCLDVVLESKAGAILVWRGAEGTVPASSRRLGIGVVPTVDAGLAALVEAEQHSSEGGLVDRLRKLLGLSAKTARSRGR